MLLKVGMNAQFTNFKSQPILSNPPLGFFLFQFVSKTQPDPCSTCHYIPPSAPPPNNLLQGCASAVPLRGPAAVRLVCQSTSRRLCFRIETAGARDTRTNDAAAASASSAHLTPREMRALRLRTPSFTHVEQLLFEASAARRRRISIARGIGALAYPVAIAVVSSASAAPSALSSSPVLNSLPCDRYVRCPAPHALTSRAHDLVRTKVTPLTLRLRWASFSAANVT